MELDNLSRDQLKAICKQKGIKNFWSWGKQQMIKEIRRVTFEAEQAVKENHDVDIKEEVANVIEEEIATEPAVEQDVVEETEPTEEAVEKVVSKSKGGPLSPQARKWKAFFEKCNISPTEWLKRYPDHKFKEFIEELV